MKILLKCFQNNLNIAAILAPGPEFFSLKCVQFPLAFTE